KLELPVRLPVKSDVGGRIRRNCERRQSANITVRKVKVQNFRKVKTRQDRYFMLGAGTFDLRNRFYIQRVVRLLDVHLQVRVRCAQSPVRHWPPFRGELDSFG